MNLYFKKVRILVLFYLWEFTKINIEMIAIMYNKFYLTIKIDC